MRCLSPSEEGDPERPVILGSAWNMSDAIPNDRHFWGGETHNNDVKRIVTKSGHRISLIDKQGEESIGIRDADTRKTCIARKKRRDGPSGDCDESSITGT